MNNQNFLRIATIVLSLLITGMLGWSHLQKTAERAKKKNAPQTNPAINPPDGAAAISPPTLQVGSFHQTSPSTNPTNKTGSGRSSELALRVGVIGSTPERDDITMISKMPITSSKIRVLYRDAQPRTCRMLVPGVPVAPPRTQIHSGVSGRFGRITTFTIGLELDFDGRNKLPAVVRGQVEKYFQNHRLSIQPSLYHDQHGHLYFGTDCQAAFYDISSPGVTVKAEPMIDEAIGRFRALGIVGGTNVEEMINKKSLGRTLAMAFTFEKADHTVTSLGDRGQLVTELMLLHLPENATAKNPNIQIFITSEARTTLHRLDISNESLNSPTPTISADVRFVSTVLMGLYPADPVVTAMRYRSNGVVSMESIGQMAKAGRLPNGEVPTNVLTITDILDQFGELSKNAPSVQSPVATDPPRPKSSRRFRSTAERVDELLERRRLSKGGRKRSGRNPPLADGNGYGEKPEMMTGLGK